MLDLANVQAPIDTAKRLATFVYVDPEMYQH